MRLKGYLPTTKEETVNIGWKKVDIIIVTGDAYLDHPFFETVSAARLLISRGYRVALLSCPDTAQINEMNKFGEPELFFYVTAGVKDSMAANYTPFLKYKSTDPYQPAGKRGNRPDRALIRYTQKIREKYKSSIIIIGGMEASLRRISHYDFWSGKVRKPVIFDAKADLLLYGQVELNLEIIARHLRGGGKLNELDELTGTAYICSGLPGFKHVTLPEFNDVAKDKTAFLEMEKEFFANLNQYTSLPLVQKVTDRYLVVNKPARPYSQEELDYIYELPYTRKQHPAYQGEIPAKAVLDGVIMAHRGKPLGDYFGTAVLHYGRDLAWRSTTSLRNECMSLAKAKLFKNFFRSYGPENPDLYGIQGKNLTVCGKCFRLACTAPDYCPNLTLVEKNRGKLLLEIDQLEGVRNHYLAPLPDSRLLARDPDFMKDLIMKRHNGFVTFFAGSAQDTTRKLLDLEPWTDFAGFIEFFKKRCGEYGKKVEVRVEVIAGFPGEDLAMTVDNLLKLNKLEVVVSRVYPFVPLPGTKVACIYHTGICPRTGVEIEVSHGMKLKEEMVLLYNTDKKNHPEIHRIMKRIGQEKHFNTIFGIKK